MLFADYERYTYARSPLVETICQLKFPPILQIDAKQPADFQEAVRQQFPQYSVRAEHPAPRLLHPGTPQQKLEQPAPIQNHQFVSADGRWKINLTRDFIALSTLHYTTWEDFAQRLDRLLVHFLQIYRPAPFLRVGLRYINAFSRQALGMEGRPWNDLLEPPFLGPLDEEDVAEEATRKCSVELETQCAGEVLLHLRCGPGRLTAAQPGSELRFLLDSDLAAAGPVPPERLAQRLEQLHRRAVQLFLGCMTQTLFTALGPTPAE